MAAELGAGLRMFRDILRRADKNDEGKLPFDEFKAYFADRVLSGEELHELFRTIDTHNTEIHWGSCAWQGRLDSQRTYGHLQLGLIPRVNKPSSHLPRSPVAEPSFLPWVKREVLRSSALAANSKR